MKLAPSRRPSMRKRAAGLVGALGEDRRPILVPAANPVVDRRRRIPPKSSFITRQSSYGSANGMSAAKPW